jgi:protein tyrosine/serine phosphatase
VRDLGGFPLPGGGETRWSAVVRSDNPGRLTRAGLDALRAHGVRTVVDLRDPVELVAGEPSLAREFEVARVPLFDFGDDQFWRRWRGRYEANGRFYGEALERWPERFAAAVAAIGHAPPGAVLVHCQVGRDRTGLVAALLLSLAGVDAEEIAADYALSADRLRPLYDEWLRVEEDPRVRARLERENVSEAAAMLALLERLDAEAYLRAAGATAADLTAARNRLR